MSLIEDFAVESHGLEEDQGAQTLVLLHGYGCDKTMWDGMLPALSSQYRVITYNLAGCGTCDPASYDRDRYATLEGHAQDLVAIVEALELEKPVLVGHSVSAMTVALAANALGDRVSEVVMICPSPSFINDGDYVGGFEAADIDALLETLDANYLGWSSEMAPAIMGTPDKPANGERLTASFCQSDPDIARHFARVTFLSDHRDAVQRLQQRTLVLQCRDDIIVPPVVGQWMEDHMPDAELVVLDATGHCPHISYPAETTAALTAFLESDAS